MENSMDKEANCDLRVPFEVKDLEPKQNDKLLRIFKGEKEGFCRVGSAGYLLRRGYKKIASSIYSLTLRESDVIVSGFTRSGTNWTQEAVWLIANDLDFATAKSQPKRLRYYSIDALYKGKCFPEHQHQVVNRNRNNSTNLKLVDLVHNMTSDHLAEVPSPRFFKSHLPLSLLPPNLLQTAKMVYVARDPRDVAVSYYFFCKTHYFTLYDGDFKQFWTLFMNNDILRTPFFDGVKEAWAMKHNPNLLFLFYEDMLKDLPGAVRRISIFFGKHYSEDQVKQLCDHLSFKSMKENDQVNGNFHKMIGIHPPEHELIRKGVSGGWRNHFDVEMSTQADQWITRNLRGSDLRFPSMADDQP